MSDSKKYLTSEKLSEFTKELSFLKTERRKQVVESLEYAKKLGDLSENAEYNEARQQQAEVEDRINHLENLIKSAFIVDSNGGDTVSIGTSVKIQKDNDKEIKEYKIVGSEESDMSSGKISNLSPLGSSLLGKKKGERVTVMTPKGAVSYTLLSF